MTQLNTPYPATAYLTAFLRSQGFQAVQADPALELVLALFSREGLSAAAAELKNQKSPKPLARAFLNQETAYLEAVDPAIAFLQGRDPTLAYAITRRTLLPEGPRFKDLPSPDAPEAQDWAFGQLGLQDRAKHHASLFVDDLADMLEESIDPHFSLTRYGERLAASQASFDALEAALARPPTLVDRQLDALVDGYLARHQPDVVVLSVPFPGNVFGALRMAARFKHLKPSVKIAFGGGYANTELRSLSDPRIFKYVDAIPLDDGERPLLAWLKSLEVPDAPLLRTFVLRDGKVRFLTTPSLHDIPQKDLPTPTYDGLPLNSYLSLLEMLNPMHRLWSDGRWNKLTLAHGCYWKKCSFCDVTLDYIGRYDPVAADQIVDRIEALIAETGQRGFHFVDEAAPPALLKAMAERLIERGIAITWWGNVRFEKAFTPEMAQLLARSGCVAVSGGLEVASDRLLKLMNKGVTVEQVARVTGALSEAGILVHAYLMYGFPTQTEQETLDALERVRQLFAAGCIQSAFWHRFAVTAHSPIGKNPDAFSIRLLPQEEPPTGRFAHNDLSFEDPLGVDHDRLGVGLRRALYNFQQGAGLDLDARFWFKPEGLKLKATSVPARLVENALMGREAPSKSSASKTRRSR